MTVPQTTYRRSANVVFRHILDEHILVPVRGELADMQKVFALNPVGAAIWEALDSPRTQSELVEQVVQRFAVAESAAQADVTAFIAELQREGLIDVISSARNG
jgi:hypothetical protein